MKLLILVIFLFTLTGCIQPAPDPSKPTPPPAKIVFMAELIDAHNKTREEHGKKPLSLDPALQRACEEHARDMANKKFMSHTGSDGSSPFKRMTRAGYNWSSAGENVAWNQQDVASVMSTWMWSPGHRINILSGSYTNIGAACVYSTTGQPYWCVDFGTPSKGVQSMSEVEPVIEKTDNASSIRFK